MPLDVQPLTRARRTAMLLVLLALLGVSVGFAQLLVHNRRAAPKVAWNFPADLKPASITDDDPAEVEIRAVGLVAGQKRLVRGLALEVPPRITRNQQLALAHEIFAAMFNAEPSAARPGAMLHRVGVELEGTSDTGDFALLRMAVLNDQAVAICYSGAGKPADWDRLYFHHLCQRVAVPTEQPPLKRK
jgi:hypothetical protein